ncbi:hypothetical protein FRC04_007993 [Tulasnella sp. 424]|nr:hypothetical protein FRC04_007993 [Tulasnella sp. 424]
MTSANADIPNRPKTVPEATLRQRFQFNRVQGRPSGFKNVAGNYLKHDHQIIWVRNARNIANELSGLVEASPRGSDILVIHPVHKVEWFYLGVWHVLAHLFVTSFYAHILEMQCKK